jgi:hypothetical protein
MSGAEPDPDFRNSTGGFRAPCQVAPEDGDYLDIDPGFDPDGLGFAIKEDNRENIAVLTRDAVEALRDYLTHLLAAPPVSTP